MFDHNYKDKILTRSLVFNNLVDNIFYYGVIDKNRTQTIYKTNLILRIQNVRKNDLNSRFICSINPFNRHLLFNPHELPCGNILCLECIYGHYNLFTKHVKLIAIY